MGAENVFHLRFSVAVRHPTLKALLSSEEYLVSSLRPRVNILLLLGKGEGRKKKKGCLKARGREKKKIEFARE